jgi:hypothetical protein
LNWESEAPSHPRSKARKKLRVAKMMSVSAVTLILAELESATD